MPTAAAGTRTGPCWPALSWPWSASSCLGKRQRFGRGPGWQCRGAVPPPRPLGLCPNSRQRGLGGGGAPHTCGACFRSWNSAHQARHVCVPVTELPVRPELPRDPHPGLVPPSADSGELAPGPHPRNKLTQRPLYTRSGASALCPLPSGSQRAGLGPLAHSGSLPLSEPPDDPGDCEGQRRRWHRSRPGKAGTEGP